MISSHEQYSSVAIPTVTIGHLEILNCTVDEGLRLISDAIEYQTPTQVVFVNTHVVNKIHRTPLAPILDGAIKFNDGVGMDIAARINGSRFVENLNGTDFLPRLLHKAWLSHWGIFVYGAQQNALNHFIDKVNRTFPGLSINGIDGYGNASCDEIIRIINASEAQILLVALGVPDQEIWLASHLEQTSCLVGIGVGAFVDMYGGTITRAPKIWRLVRCEWLWRLVHEPRRLWRRYLVEGPGFLYWSLQNRDR